MKSTVRKLNVPVLYGVMVLLGAYTSQSGAQEASADVRINIVFNSDMCPVAVDPATAPDVHKYQRIVWQSVDQEGAAVEQVYTVYFDPFAGSTLRSKSDGRLKSPPFDSKAPATEVGIEYKYTILGDQCPDAPYDPRFRLR